MRELHFLEASCPYCGEPIELAVDASAQDQDYIEDCSVCCRPIAVAVRVDDDGELCVELRAESE